MLLLAHTLTGAVIGTKISNPYLVIILSFFSHIILDIIPHSNLPFPKKADPIQILKTMPDVIPSLGIYFLFLFYFPGHWLNITLGVTFAILIDFLTLFSLMPKLNGIMSKFYHFHEIIQGETKLFLGLLTQSIYILTLLLILKS